jgi:hypothetical protein
MLHCSSEVIVSVEMRTITNRPLTAPCLVLETQESCAAIVGLTAFILFASQADGDQLARQTVNKLAGTTSVWCQLDCVHQSNCDDTRREQLQWKSAPPGNKTNGRHIFIINALKPIEIMH